LKFAVILGTRPEIIKMSPIIRELKKRDVDYFILHTGQHYSYNMDRIFFEQLKLPGAKYNLEVGSCTHAEQTAKILMGVEKILNLEKPDIVLVEGDTNTVLAGALAASKLRVKVGHVEAGLRSYDRQMPEEINRILTDHCSDYLFAPTQKAKDILLSEGIPEKKIFVTGNTIVDAVFQNLAVASNNGYSISDLKLKPKDYFLVTLHRQENVDDFSRFESILKGLDKLADKYKYPIIYPMHPRSRKKMHEFGLISERIKLIDPIDYFGFLKLEENARMILTDSGGVQEESCILGTPCITLRDNTERPETLEVGANMLAGSDSSKIVECSEIMLQKSNEWQNPFGDGNAGEKIINIFLKINNI
jgi:UDP-N-acetylglucosamine 2-epimerase (non-hydrolysing)